MKRERICLGFDGSDSDDWTALKAETFDGHIFTPTYGPDRRPTIWDPAEWGGRVPRLEVHAAMDHVFKSHDVQLGFFDSPWWQSEIDEWAAKYGEERVVVFDTYRPVQMHSALERFYTDLSKGGISHDGCRITGIHMANARKAARPNERYILSKPAGAQHQKIDAAMATVLAHEAAATARAAGWEDGFQDVYIF